MSARPTQRFLLDTQAFIWWATADLRISAPAREVIAEAEHAVYLSAVTPWEIAIKHALGRLQLAEDPASLVHSQIARHGYERLPITIEHALAVAELPDHHADPFDRLLIGQARVEELVLISADAALRAYEVEVVS